MELTLCPLSVGKYNRHALVGMVLGGEPIEVRGATPDGRVVLEVSRCQHEVSFVLGSRTQIVGAKLETFLIDLDAGVLVLTCERRALIHLGWRYVYPTPSAQASPFTPARTRLIDWACGSKAVRLNQYK